MAFFAISFSAQQKKQMAYLHSHGYYELYFQLEGSRSYFYNNEYYLLKKNSLVTTKPNTLHKFDGGPYQRILISAGADLFSPAQIEFLNKLENEVITFSDDAILQMKETLDALLELQNSVAEDKQIQIVLKLGLLFHQIHTADRETIKSELSIKSDFTNYLISPAILKIMDYIQNNYNKQISLDDLCKICSLSKTWICKCFWEANHMTVFNYKLSLQLNKAKSLLVETTYSIERIASLTGFSSPNYFSMQFKKNEGISPLRYRRQFFKKK